MNKKEMANIIYDTLFENTQFEQFDTLKVSPLVSIYGEDDNYDADSLPTQEVDASEGIIRFGYMGKEFEITIKEIEN